MINILCMTREKEEEKKTLINKESITEANNAMRFMQTHESASSVCLRGAWISALARYLFPLAMINITKLANVSQLEF